VRKIRKKERKQEYIGRKSALISSKRERELKDFSVQFRGLKHYLGKALILSYTKLAELSEDKRSGKRFLGQC
jgi:hypothetical protein